MIFFITTPEVLRTSPSLVASSRLASAAARSWIMFGSLRSPTWHVPLPWLTGESAPDAALWREHLANRRRMGAELAARGVRDVPWSSWRRLQGVVLTCVTFGLWIVAGVASVALFALAPVIAPAHAVHVRGAIAAYYALALVYAAPFNQRVYDYAASLEVGAENGWKLIVKVRHDADRPFDPHRAAIPRPKPPVSLRPPPLPPRVPTSSDARRTLHRPSIRPSIRPFHPTISRSRATSTAPSVRTYSARTPTVCSARACA